MTTTYWLVGRRIVEQEQGGESRAEYGEAVLKHLSADLTDRFGRRFSERNLEQMRAFHVGWPISQTLFAKSLPPGRILCSFHGTNSHTAIMISASNTTPRRHFSDRNVEITQEFYDRNSSTAYDVSLKNNIKLRAHARQMRRHPTSSEYILWTHLKAKQIHGVQFRRQQILLGRRIVDFLAPKLKLVVEVQGGYHDLQPSADARRARELERAGYRMLFVSHELVLAQPLVVVAKVEAVVAQLLAA